MDVRVFPFAFPPIKGGAQGGDSPTPTPPEIVTPYDLTNAHFDVTWFVASGDWGTTGGNSISAVYLGITGLEPANISNVSLLEITSGLVEISADGVDMIEDESFTRITQVNTYTGVDVSQTSYSPYPRGTMSGTDWNTKMAGKAAAAQAFLTLKAYDNNGNLLQTHTWTAVLE